MKVLITGSEGFIGYHLYNSIKYKFKDLTLLNFKKEYFEDDSIIDKLVNNADVLIHLSGVNRLNDQKLLYDQNLLLTKKVVESINRVNFRGARNGDATSVAIMEELEGKNFCKGSAKN